MTEGEKLTLLRAVEREYAAMGQNYILPVHLGLIDALILVSHLQLALRHPANLGSSSGMARSICDAIIARFRADGLVKHAELAEAGFDPVNDEPRLPRPT